MDIDRALERAMEADDPGPAFAGRVIAAITGDAAARATRHRVDADGPAGRLARAAAARGDRRPHRRRRAVAGGPGGRRAGPRRPRAAAAGAAAHRREVERRAPRHRAEPGVGVMRIKGLWTVALTVWLVPVMSARAERRPGRADARARACRSPGWRSWRRRRRRPSTSRSTPACSRSRPGSWTTSDADDAQVKADDVRAQGHLRPQLRVRRRRRLRPGRRRDDPPAAVGARLVADGRRPQQEGQRRRRRLPVARRRRRSAGSASSPPSRGASPSSTSSAPSTSISSAASRGSACPSSISSRTRTRRRRTRPRTSRSPTRTTELTGAPMRAQVDRRIHLGRSWRCPSPDSGASALIGCRTGEIMPAGWKPARRSACESMQTRPIVLHERAIGAVDPVEWDRFAAASDGSFLGSWKVIRAERIRHTVRVFEFSVQGDAARQDRPVRRRDRRAQRALPRSHPSAACARQRLGTMPAARSSPAAAPGTCAYGSTWNHEARCVAAAGAAVPRGRVTDGGAPSRLHRLRGLARLRSLSPRRQREPAARLQEGGRGRADPSYHEARRRCVPRRAGAGRSPPAGDARGTMSRSRAWSTRRCTR